MAGGMGPPGFLVQDSGPAPASGATTDEAEAAKRAKPARPAETGSCEPQRPLLGQGVLAPAVRSDRSPQKARGGGEPPGRKGGETV
jgi:hypothetical protein